MGVYKQAHNITISFLKMSDRVHILPHRNLNGYDYVIYLYDENESAREESPKKIYIHSDPPRHPERLEQWVDEMTNAYKAAVDKITKGLTEYRHVGLYNQSSNPALAHQVLFAFLLKTYVGCDSRARWDLFNQSLNGTYPLFNAFFEHYIISELVNVYGFYDNDDDDFE